METKKSRIGLLSGLVMLGSLTACSKPQSNLRITNDTPAAPPAATAKVRVEPVFYNGKTYQVTLSPTEQGYDMRVAGMGAAQKKDAEAVATSSLRYFACKDSQQIKVTAKANFDSGLWRMSGLCV